VRSSWTAPQDVRILDLMPHMHKRGKDFTYTAVYPDGRSEVVLRVPKYDFNWQLLYNLKERCFCRKARVSIVSRTSTIRRTTSTTRMRPRKSDGVRRLGKR